VNETFIIGAVGVLSPVIPIGVGVKLYPHLSGELRLLLLYCVASLLAGIIGFSLALRGVNSNAAGYIFTFFQFLVFVVLFSRWQGKKWARVFLLLLLAGFFLFWVTGVFLVKDSHAFSKLTRPVAAVLLVLAAAITLFQLLISETSPILNNSIFWVSAGVLTYCTGMTMLLSLSDVLLRISHETVRLLWASIQTSLHLLLNVFFAIGFLCLRPKLR
jgi:hypothetical protein